MRFSELIFLSVILAVFFTTFTGLFSQFLQLNERVEEVRNKADSMQFISESFYNVCEGKGLASFDEWKRVCTGLWNLDCIEWKSVEESESMLIYGKWSGPYGCGEVYATESKK